MRIFSYLILVVAVLAGAADVRAQWPGEVRGVVLDVLSGRPVPVATVTLGARPGHTAADASGRFRLRGVEPGRYTLTAHAPGYGTLEREVSVENGSVVEVRLELAPEIVEVEGVVARVVAEGSGGGASRALVLSAEDLRAIPARSVGDLIATLPGVRVVARGRGSAEIPSIRGSAGDAVLVLVDGVPINDPLTGEADLSSLPASTVTGLRVLPGGQSARYGARAEAGVIVVETGVREGVGWSLGGGAGALGEKFGDVRYAHSLGPGTLSLGGGLSRLDGGFDFEIPEAAGGGSETRRNAHVRAEEGRMEWAGASPTLRFRLGAGGEHLERGLPGRSFVPSPTGSQELDRGRVSGAVEIMRPSGGAFSLSGYLQGQRTRHSDAAPPLGEPFDEETGVRGAGVELTLSRPLARRLTVSSGLSASYLRVRSSQLADSAARTTRWDRGLWASSRLEGPAGTSFSAALRLDRSGIPSRWYASHDVSATWSRPGFSVRAGHRSSFSPPTLGDQFFREGVGVEPNPELEAERVPSEWSLGASLEGELAGLRGTLGVEAYRGDIRGMIVWLPDFRFVWSPRNQDVRRRGVDLNAGLRSVRTGFEVRSNLSLNRTTYVRPGSEDVQVVYRPVVSGGVVGGWNSSTWRVSLASEYTGARYPVPNRVNELHGFWTTDLRLSRTWRTALGSIETLLEIDRLFDHEDTVIFAFPDPGRTLRLSLEIGR